MQNKANFIVPHQWFARTAITKRTVALGVRLDENGGGPGAASKAAPEEELSCWRIAAPSPLFHLAVAQADRHFSEARVFVRSSLVETTMSLPGRGRGHSRRFAAADPDRARNSGRPHPRTPNMRRETGKE